MKTPCSPPAFCRISGWSPSGAITIQPKPMALAWPDSSRPETGFMPSRGNFGLELTIANYEGALDAPDDRVAFRNRMREVHPFLDGEGRKRYRHYQRDVDYFDVMGHEARAWIAAHPAEFAQLSAKHLRQLMFPPAWLYDRYMIVDIRPIDRLRQVIAWTTAALST